MIYAATSFAMRGLCAFDDTMFDPEEPEQLFGMLTIAAAVTAVAAFVFASITVALYLAATAKLCHGAKTALAAKRVHASVLETAKAKLEERVEELKGLVAKLRAQIDEHEGEKERFAGQVTQLTKHVGAIGAAEQAKTDEVVELGMLAKNLAALQHQLAAQLETMKTFPPTKAQTHWPLPIFV